MSKFILDTDHPIDKIIWLYEGDLALDEFGFGEKTMAHGIGAQIFVQGIWSVDNWQTTNSFGTERQEGQVMTYGGDVGSDSTNVHFFITAASAINGTAKVRLWGFVNEIETLNLPLKATADISSNKFIFNTDFRYPKLIMEGYSNASTTVTHNLNTFPYVDVWVLRTGETMYSFLNRDMFDSNDWGEPLLKITKTSLVFGDEEYYPVNKYYYRVYEP